MANSSRSLYYVCERPGSRAKNTQDEGCQLQLRYLLFISKEGSVYMLYTHVYIIIGTWNLKCSNS